MPYNLKLKKIIYKKCNYCQKEIGAPNNVYMELQFARSGTGHKNEKYHLKCFYKNFIARDIIYPKCICGKRVRGTFIRIFQSHNYFKNLILDKKKLYEYKLHLDCFNKYWMLNPNGRPK